MRKLFAAMLAVVMLVPAAFAENAVLVPRVLVAYLSRSGENYNVGVPREDSASAAFAGYIEKGNTAIVAEIIAEAVKGELFAITTVTPYPDDYAEMLRVAREEIDTDARPELAGTVEDMDDYDVVFIGYPIWHGRLPQAIRTFMESYDLSGKTVIPFNTHEGSGQSGTQQAIESALPESAVLQGLAVQGKTAQEDAEQTRALVSAWLEGLDLRVSADKAAVLAAYETIQQAMIDKDTLALNRMILDGATFVHMSGKTQTKEEFFEDIENGTLNYYSYVVHAPQITVNGDEAVLLASVTQTAKLYGASGDWTLPVNARFIRIDGEWYCYN